LLEVSAGLYGVEGGDDSATLTGPTDAVVSRLFDETLELVASVGAPATCFGAGVGNIAEAGPIRHSIVEHERLACVVLEIPAEDCLGGCALLVPLRVEDLVLPESAGFLTRLALARELRVDDIAGFPRVMLQLDLAPEDVQPLEGLLNLLGYSRLGLAASARRDDLALLVPENALLVELLAQSLGLRLTKDDL
jgi:hypothetical protein